MPFPPPSSAESWRNRSPGEAVRSHAPRVLKSSRQSRIKFSGARRVSRQTCPAATQRYTVPRMSIGTSAGSEDTPTATRKTRVSLIVSLYTKTLFLSDLFRLPSGTPALAQRWMIRLTYRPHPSRICSRTGMTETMSTRTQRLERNIQVFLSQDTFLTAHRTEVLRHMDTVPAGIGASRREAGIR